MKHRSRNLGIGIVLGVALGCRSDDVAAPPHNVRFVAPGEAAAFKSAVQTGGIAVSVQGLQQPAYIVVAGPSGYRSTISGTRTLTGLPIGTYTISASPVIAANGAKYIPAPASVVRSVTPNSVTSVTLSYVRQYGMLAVHVNGLPTGVAGVVTVSAPGYSISVSTSRILMNLNPVTHAVTASPLTYSGYNYVPAPASQSIAVPANGASSVTVTYTRKTPPAPSVTSVGGRPWRFPDNSFAFSNPGWKGYLQVPYAGYPPINVYVNGAGLDRVTSVATSARGYKISIAHSTPNQLVLNIQGSSAANGVFDEQSPAPVANFPLTLNHAGGAVAATVLPGVIPVFNADYQAWGQCTWYAGYVARIRAGKSPVQYSDGVPLSGDPARAGFPRVNSVVMAPGMHMAFVEGVSASSKQNSDGSVTTTYTLTGSQYNADGKGSRSSFSKTMVVTKRGNTYAVTTPPVVVYTVTAVKQ